MAKSERTEGLVELHEELSRAFDFFNRELWAGKLPPVVLNFHPQPPNGALLGHYKPQSWRDPSSGELKDEIVFYADLCLMAGMEEVLETELHEMAHHWQQHLGKPSPHGHHNREWHQECARIGLATSPGDPKGFSKLTATSRALIERLKPRVESVPFRQLAAAGGRGPTKLRKWSCPCGVNVRVGRAEFHAHCDLCDGAFRPAD